MRVRSFAIAVLSILAAPLAAQSAGAPPTLWLFLFPVDSVSSGGVLPAVAMRHLPIDDPRQALLLVPGVRLTSGAIGIGVDPVLSVRGASTAPQVLVDGAPMRSQLFGTQAFGVDAVALDAAGVGTGVAPVTVPDAGAGVIAYDTRAGTDTLTGAVRWSSDEPFADASSVGFNHITGAAGGRVGGRLRFAASAALVGQRAQYRGIGAADVPVFVPSGIDTSVALSSGDEVTLPAFVANDAGLRRPFDWSSARRLHGRLDYRYGERGALALTAIASQLQQRLYPGQSLLDPASYRGRRASAAMVIATLRHPIGAGATLVANLSFAKESDVDGPLDAASEVESRDPYLGIAFSALQFTGRDLLPETESIVRNVRTNSGVRVPYLNRADLQQTQAHRTDPYGMISGWPTQGIGGSLTTGSERRLQGRIGVELARAAQHVTLGVDVERADVSLYTSRLLSQAFMDVFAEQPQRLGAFASDRIVAGGGTVIEIGVRYDRYAPGGEFPRTPGRIYSNPGWSPNAATSDTAYAASLARVFAPVGSRGYISPRLRLSAPLAPHATMRVGYSRAVEPPPWALFFHNANSDLDFTSASGDFFGRDIPFAVASLIDLGARVALTPRVAIDLGVYRREGEQYVVRIQPFADPLNVGDTINLSALTTAQDDVPWGIEARLDWQPVPWLGASAHYAVGKREGGISSTTGHAVTAVIQAERSGFSAVILGHGASGDPYSRLANSGAGYITPFFVVGPVGPVGISTLPWTKRLDVRVGKTLRAGGRDWELFADLRNALNFTNVTALFAETGAVTNDLFRQQRLAAEYANLAGEAAGNSALLSGNTINLSACGTWADPVNCVALTRVERRFGDGDGLYTQAEQDRALNAFYDSVYGPWRFSGAGRTLRIGAQLVL